MTDYSRIRDTIHQRLLAAGVCGPGYYGFLMSRGHIDKEIEQLIGNMPFVLERNCISEVDLVTLIEAPDIDISPAYPSILAWAVKTNRDAFLDWFLPHTKLSMLYPDAMHLAATSGFVEVLRVLIKHGADPTFNDSSPLRYAAANGHLEAVKLLAAAGADPAARNGDALRWARSGGFHSVEAFLSQR